MEAPKDSRSEAPGSHSRRAGIILLAVAIAALLPAAYRMTRPFLTAMVLAAILAVVLDPLQQRAGRLVKRSSLAALITTVLAVGPVLAVTVIAGVVVNREIKAGAFGGISAAWGRLTTALATDHEALQRALAQLSQVAAGIFTAAMAVLFLYVFLLYGRGWLSQLAAMLPLDAPVTDRILCAIRDAMVANVDGILAVSATEAILFGIAFWVAGIGSPATWGAIAGLASMLPIVGAMAVWLPIAVTIAVKGAYAKAVLLALGCLAVQEGVALFLLPRALGGRLRQPPLLIALSVLGGTDAFGAVGILLGPVIVSVLAALVQEFRLQLRPQSG
jgi:predicted PurR-regulated permease PerM